MNRRMQFKIKQLIIIVISWMAIGFIIAVYDHLVLRTHSAQGPAPDYSFPVALAINIGAGLIGALLGGSFLVFYINVKYQDKSYAYTVIAVTVSFILIIILINIALSLLGIPDLLRMAKNGLVWSIIVAITQFLIQINSKFGHGIFWDIIRGKYNTPKEERRIFMFLDINSSTTIAEKLGDQKYHELLKDFFSDITNPIIDNKGEIYQYVGDEVVVAWKYEDGIQNGKCINCFFDIKTQIHSLQDKYIRRYGVVPAFKAGIHCGQVIAGEVGIIKRDITYSGDVLNTTSRIQSLCKEFNQEIIASADLITELGITSNYTLQTLGSIKLRGKEKEMMLVALAPIH